MDAGGHGQRWTSHRIAGWALRLLILAAPVALSVFVVTGLTRLVTKPDGGPGLIAWWGFVLLAGSSVVYTTELLLRRVLPLVALLKLSLVFPDRAPARFGVALRTGTPKQLERRMAEVAEEGLGDTPQEAAEALLSLVAALSVHDRLTRGHCERVRAYTDVIARELDLSPEDTSKLHWAAMVHDVGKLLVPAEILSKPGRLTDAEFEIIKTHPEAGARLAAPLVDWLGEWFHAIDEHHERWDGAGYPRGIGGTDISLAGRIVAVADVYDVITAARSYKKPRPAAEARAELARCAGTQFDPEIVRAFLNISLGRLRLMLGPLSWFGELPVVGRATIAPAGGTATAALTAAAAAVASLVGVFLSPHPAQAEAAPAPVVEVAAEAAPATVPPTSPPAELATTTTTAPPTTAPRTAGPADTTVRLTAGASASFDVGAAFGRTTATAIRILQAPEHGRVELDGFVLRYHADPDRSGAVTVRYEVCDADACHTASVTFLVEPAVLDAVDDDVVTDEDEPTAIAVLANDRGGVGRRHLVSVSTGALGSVSIVGDEVRYVPDPDAWGIDRFTYVVADEGGVQREGRASVEVRPVNDAPRGEDDVVAVAEDGEVTVDVLANDGDVEGGVLRATITTGPERGTATLRSDGHLTYRPAQDQVGADRIAYEVRDAEGAAGHAEVLVTIDAVNDAPTFVGAADVVVPEDVGPVVLPAWVSAMSAGPGDEAGGPTTAAVHTSDTSLFAAPPALSPDGTLRFTPAADAFGTTSLEVTVTDAEGASTRRTALLTITPVNDAPTIEGAPAVVVAEDHGPTTVPAWITGASGGPANEHDTVQLVVTPAHGALFSAAPALLPDGTLTFTPAPDACGTTTLTVVATDGQGATTTRTVLLTIAPVNDAPTFDGAADVAVLEDGGPTVVLGWVSGLSAGPANEADTATWAATATDPTLLAAGPTLAPDGTLTFTPAPDAYGTTTLTATATDSHGATTTHTATLTITPVNDAPTFTGGTDLTVAEDDGPTVVLGWVTGLSAGPANEADTATWAATATDPTLLAAGPTLAPDGTLTFTPAPDAYGTTTLTATATDSHGATTTHTATLTITPVNDAPTFTGGTDLTVAEDDGPTVVLGWVTGLSAGPANEADTATWPATATDPTLLAAGPTLAPDGTLTFTPADNLSGTTTLTVTATDSHGATTTHTATLTITPVNDAPVARDDAQSTPQDVPLVVPAAQGLLANDSDVDGDAVTVTSASAGAGSVTWSADGAYTYTPAPGSTAPDLVSYTVSDGQGGTASAVLAIEIQAVPNPVQTLYLRAPALPGAAATLSATPGAPGIEDGDGDGNPGTTIRKSGGKVDEADPTKRADFDLVATSGLQLDGPVTITLAGSTMGQLGKAAHPHLYLLDCAADGTSCTTVASFESHLPHWSDTTPWVEHTFSFGAVQHVVAAGRALRISVLNDHNDLWLGTSAGASSRLTITTP